VIGSFCGKGMDVCGNTPDEPAQADKPIRHMKRIEKLCGNLDETFID